MQDAQCENVIKRTITVEAVELATPSISKVTLDGSTSSSKTIQLGDTVKIATTVENTGEVTSNDGEIQFSFPQLVNSTHADWVSYNGDSGLVYAERYPGGTSEDGKWHSLCTADGSNGTQPIQVSAKNLLAYGVSGAWTAGRSYTVSVDFTPTEVGTYNVYIKSAMHVGDDWDTGAGWLRAPSDSSSDMQDAQCENVIKRTIIVKAPVPEISMSTLNNSVNINGEQQISVTLTNTGDTAYSGSISVSFPDYQDVQDSSLVQSLDGVIVKSAGNGIFVKGACEASEATPADYLLVEHYQYGWINGESKTLTFTVLPKEGVDKIRLNVRGTMMGVECGESVTVIPSNVGGSSNIDQQKYEVAQYKIQVIGNLVNYAKAQDVFLKNSEDNYLIIDVSSVDDVSDYGDLLIQNVTSGTCEIQTTPNDKILVLKCTASDLDFLTIKDPYTSDTIINIKVVEVTILTQEQVDARQVFSDKVNKVTQTLEMLNENEASKVAIQNKFAADRENILNALMKEVDKGSLNPDLFGEIINTGAWSFNEQLKEQLDCSITPKFTEIVQTGSRNSTPLNLPFEVSITYCNPELKQITQTINTYYPAIVDLRINNNQWPFSELTKGNDSFQGVVVNSKAESDALIQLLLAHETLMYHFLVTDQEPSKYSPVERVMRLSNYLMTSRLLIDHAINSQSSGDGRYCHSDERPGFCALVDDMNLRLAKLVNFDYIVELIAAKQGSTIQDTIELLDGARNGTIDGVSEIIHDLTFFLQPELYDVLFSGDTYVLLFDKLVDVSVAVMKCSRAYGKMEFDVELGTLTLNTCMIEKLETVLGVVFEKSIEGLTLLPQALINSTPYQRGYFPALVGVIVAGELISWAKIAKITKVDGLVEGVKDAINKVKVVSKSRFNALSKMKLKIRLGSQADSIPKTHLEPISQDYIKIRNQAVGKKINIRGNDVYIGQHSNKFIASIKMNDDNSFPLHIKVQGEEKLVETQMPQTAEDRINRGIKIEPFCGKDKIPVGKDGSKFKTCPGYGEGSDSPSHSGYKVCATNSEELDQCEYYDSQGLIEIKSYGKVYIHPNSCINQLTHEDKLIPRDKSAAHQQMHNFFLNEPERFDELIENVASSFTPKEFDRIFEKDSIFFAGCENFSNQKDQYICGLEKSFLSIADNIAPPGLSWHHDLHVGEMSLVKKKYRIKGLPDSTNHQILPHIGGDMFWCNRAFNP